MTRRRRFLAVAGAAVTGLGGCLGGDSPSESTPTAAETITDRERTRSPTSTPTPERTTAPPDVPLDVTIEALQRGVIRIHSVDATTVSGSAVDQYLLLHTERPKSVPSAKAPALTEFALRFDGETHPPRGPEWSSGLERAHGVTPYSDGTGLVVFVLPGEGDASDAAVTWPGGEWPIPDPTRERLAAPVPPLSVDVTVPETVPAGTVPTLTIEVTNEGEQETTFVCAIDRSGIGFMTVAQIRAPVPPGETVTETIEDEGLPADSAADDGEATATYDIEWAGGSTERRVRVVDS